MSLIFIDGFDHYRLIRDKWQVAGAFDQPLFVAGRFGGQACEKQFQNAQQSIRQTLGAQTEVFFGCAFNPPGFPGTFTESMFRLEDLAGTVICNISLSPAGLFTITAGGNSDTTLSALATGQYHYVEVHYIAKDAGGKGGVAELRVNEVVVASIDGTTLATTTEADDDIMTFGFMDDGTNSPKYKFDDLYILNGSGSENNGYLGDVRITTLKAGANGGTNDWTVNDPLLQNFEAVDELLMNSIAPFDYVESGLVGAAEDYNNESFAERAIAPGQIFGVQVANGTLRTATAAITFKNEMVVAGVRFSDDVEYTPGNTDYFIETYVEDTDPSDSATWTEAKVAAVGSGLIITSKVTI